MNGVFERLIPAITQYGGTPSRLLGDAVLALFGAPLAHEDDPYRAVLAALAMLAAFGPYRDSIRTQLAARNLILEPADFHVRIGLNTGLAIVGEVGSGTKRDYTAMGDAVNLAARMEQTAVPGTIQITHDTAAAVNDYVNLEALKAITVKGKKEPVQAYRVQGLKSPSTRRDSRRRESPLVGRERERKQLGEVLSALAAGQGQIVCISGEGGLGKSRLLHELDSMRRSQLPQAGWHLAESYSFEETQPYGLIQRMLRRVAGISRDDPPDNLGSKIYELAAPLADGLQVDLEQLLRSLFGLPVAEGHHMPHGESFAREIQYGMRTLVSSWAAAEPLMLVFEDLHWSDPASIELIKQLFVLTESDPLSIVCAFRPYRSSAAWALKQTAEDSYPHRFRDIALQPLSASESEELVRTLLNVDARLETTSAHIIEKTAGVPYFIEEIVNDLEERGSLDLLRQGAAALAVDEMSMPDTLEAVLVSRLDRLEPPVRRVLQLASVIGRSFPYSVLQRITGDGIHLDSALQQLQRTGMIHETTRLPEAQYTFHHALAQEAAYNTILISSRRHYHKLVGEAMTSIFGDQLEEQASLLAFHFDRAGASLLAMQYYQVAGDRAARLYANEEALNHYTRAIVLADGALEGEFLEPDVEMDPVSINSSLRILHETAGSVLMHLGNYETAREHFAAGLATLSADASLDAARFYLHIGHGWSSQYRYGESAAAFEEAERILEAMPDQEHDLWVQLWIDVKFGQADLLYWQNRSAAMAEIVELVHEPVKHHGTLDQQRRFYGLRAMLNAVNLRFSSYAEGLPDSRKALAIAEQIGDKYTIANARFHVGFNLLWTGQLKEAEALLSESLRQMEIFGDLTMQNRIWTYLMIIWRFQGDTDKMRQHLQQVVTLTTNEGTPLYIGAAKANAAWLAYRVGQILEAESLAAEAMTYWEGYFYPLHWLASWILLVLALDRRDLQTAVDQAAHMLEADQQDMPDDITASLIAAVEAWPQGDSGNIEQSLSQALALAQERGYL